jgi:hypothetical protein
MLSDADVAARTSAARAVGRLGAAGVAGVPRLRALFADGPIPQRVAAGCAIHRLTREIDDLLPTFQALLRAPADDEVAVAWEDLARTVASIGPRASSLADAMGSALLRCDDAATQIATLDALATFGRAAVPALPAVRAAARAEVDSRRRNDGKGFQDLAIQTLAAMGPAAAAALPDLRVLARDPDCAKAVADAIRKITAAR